MLHKCSECLRPLYRYTAPDGYRHWPKTCGPECARARKTRLQRERRSRARTAEANTDHKQQWLHRERDKPKALTFRHWSFIVDLICLKGGIAFEHSAMLEDLHRCVPRTKFTVRDLRQVNVVEATEWRWHWEKSRPDLLRELESQRASVRQTSAVL